MERQSGRLGLKICLDFLRTANDLFRHRVRLASLPLTALRSGVCTRTARATCLAQHVTDSVSQPPTMSLWLEISRKHSCGFKGRIPPSCQQLSLAECK